MILGYHLHLAVKQILAQFAATPQTFTDAVNAGVTIDSAKIASVYGVLFPGGSAASITIGERFTDDFVKRASVAIQDDSTQSVAKVMGGFMGRQNAANANMRGEIIAENASIFVYHPSVDACRFLSGALTTRLIASRPLFVSSTGPGFIDWQCNGEGPLDLDTMVLRGWLGQYIRSSTYRAMVRLRLPDTSVSLNARDVFAAPVGTENADDVPGGVVAETIVES